MSAAKFNWTKRSEVSKIADKSRIIIAIYFKNCITGPPAGHCTFTKKFKNPPMAKYSKKSQEKVERSMHEMKHGKLKSGSGKKVTSRKQAIAIGLSEARREGAKVPKKKSSGKK